MSTEGEKPRYRRPGSSLPPDAPMGVPQGGPKGNPQNLPLDNSPVAGPQVVDPQVVDPQAADPQIAGPKANPLGEWDERPQGKPPGGPKSGGPQGGHQGGSPPGTQPQTAARPNPARDGGASGRAGSPEPQATTYKGGLFDQLDVPAFTSLVACGLLFFLAVVGVKSVDYSSLDRKTLEDIPERIAKIIMPMKPLAGKPAAIPKLPGQEAKDNAKEARAANNASAAARIERSRRTVTEQVAETQQRIQKAAVLSILSGKGPATRGASTSSRAAARGGSLVDFGGMEDNLANLEGLTKFDSKLDANNGGGKGSGTRDEGIGDMTGIDKMVKGFQNAKMGALSKVGMMELEKPELLERNSRYTGDRSMADVGTFISKKQSMVTMLYEERLKVNPTLEGKITVVLVIEEDGTVSSATILRSETTLNDPDFQNELLRRIKRWIFPPSTGGPVEMKSPFVFKPA